MSAMWVLRRASNDSSSRDKRRSIARWVFPRSSCTRTPHGSRSQRDARRRAGVGHEADRHAGLLGQDEDPSRVVVQDATGRAEMGASADALDEPVMPHDASSCRASTVIAAGGMCRRRAAAVTLPARATASNARGWVKSMSGGS